jgi:hypothetical protein
MKRILVLICCAGLAACTVTPTFKPETSVTAPSVGRPPPPSSVQAAISAGSFTPYAELGRASDDALAPGESDSALSKACRTDAGYPNANGGFGFAFVFGGLTDSAPYGRWGYLGTAEAAQDGFAVRPPGFRVVAPGAPMSKAEEKALEKCSAIVADFESAQMKGPLAGIQTLSNDIQTDVQHNPSVKAATKAWSACMAQNGYHVTDPQTAFLQALRGSGGVAYYFKGPGGSAGSIALTPSGEPGSASGQDKARNQAQIAMAVTDADCTESTDLAGIYFAVQASYEQQLVDSNQQALNQAVAQYRAAYLKELSQIPRLLRKK